MGFDGLVILMADRTDVKVGLQCFKNGLDSSYDVVILPNLLLATSLEAGLDEVQGELPYLSYHWYLHLQ